MRRVIGHERGTGKAVAKIAVIPIRVRAFSCWDCAPTSIVRARFRKSLGQVIDHRTNARRHEAATWHYRVDRHGFALILPKQSNKPASAKV